MFGVPMRRFEVCDSTNSEAAAWAKDPGDPAPHGALVVAERQRAGRGRLGRRWESLPGEHIYMSLVLRPPLEPQKVPPIALCAGLAVHGAVRALGAEALIKWPNDILVGSRKLAGILVEMAQRGAGVDYVIAGIGVNVAAAGALPAELGAIDLAEATGKVHEVAALQGDICRRLEETLAQYLSAGVAGLEAAFSQAAVSRVAFSQDEQVIEGDVVGLDRDGALLVLDAAGRRHRIVAGEVAAL